MKKILACTALLLLLTSCALPSNNDNTADPATIRLSEYLYVKKAPTASWQPYFTGAEPEWQYKSDEPWASFNGGESYSSNQGPALDAHESLYPYISELADYAGCYVSANGYLTVMLTNPSRQQASLIGERAAAPCWIIAAAYPLETLLRARGETVEVLDTWTNDHPDAPVAWYGAGIDEVGNRVEISLQGSGIARLLSELDFPDYVDFIYAPTIDASLTHEIPHEPRTAWERGGVTITSARESYPIGATFLLVTASHNVDGQRLYAPEYPLKIEKYAEGEWFDISGDFAVNDVYREVFDVAAGMEKTVQMSIFTPETLGPGLYRATYLGHVCLSSSGDTTLSSAIAGADRADHVSFEFTVTADAEPLPPQEDPK
jgi:hypothetical protein